MNTTEIAWLRVRDPENPRSHDLTKKADSFTFPNAGEIRCTIKNEQQIICDAYERTQRFLYSPIANASVGGVFVKTSALSSRNEYKFGAGPESSADGEIYYPIKKGVTCKMDTWGITVLHGLLCSMGKK